MDTRPLQGLSLSSLPAPPTLDIVSSPIPAGRLMLGVPGSNTVTHTHTHCSRPPPRITSPCVDRVWAEQSAAATDGGFVDGIRGQLAETSLAHCITGEEKLRCLYGRLPRGGGPGGPRQPLPQCCLWGLLQRLVPGASEAQLEGMVTRGMVTRGMVTQGMVTQGRQGEASASGMVSSGHPSPLGRVRGCASPRSVERSGGAPPRPRRDSSAVQGRMSKGNAAPQRVKVVGVGAVPGQSCSRTVRAAMCCHGGLLEFRFDQCGPGTWPCRSAVLQRSASIRG